MVCWNVHLVIHASLYCRFCVWIACRGYFSFLCSTFLVYPLLWSFLERFCRKIWPKMLPRVVIIALMLCFLDFGRIFCHRSLDVLWSDFDATYGQGVSLGEGLWRRWKRVKLLLLAVGILGKTRLIQVSNLSPFEVIVYQLGVIFAVL